jgi:peptide/nickel transport system ATP-binding protein
MLFITHDLGVVADICTRVLTMYAGEIIEDAPVDALLRRPLHPYASGLLQALPQTVARGAALPSIPGRVPGLHEMPKGCRFAARCAFREDACAAPQALAQAGDGRRVRCWKFATLHLRGVA